LPRKKQSTHIQKEWRKAQLERITHLDDLYAANWKGGEALGKNGGNGVLSRGKEGSETRGKPGTVANEVVTEDKRRKGVGGGRREKPSVDWGGWMLPL
jgi:hypothetical protein